MYDLYEGRRGPTQGDEADDDGASSSSSSSSPRSSESDELLMVEEAPKETKKEDKKDDENDTFVAITLDVDETVTGWPRTKVEEEASCG